MAKRKTQVKEPKSSKKAKSVPQASLLSQKEITDLANEVLEKSKYNSLVPLLSLYDEIEKVLLVREDEKVESTARLLTLELYKCFQKVVKEDVLAEKGNEKKQLVAKWVLDKYVKYKERLCWLVQAKLAFQSSLQLDALDFMLGLVKTEDEAAKEFPVDTYQQLVQALLLSECGTILSDQATDNFVILEFLDKFSKYWDLQVYFFEKSLVQAIESWTSTPLLFANYLTIIRNGLLYPDVEELPLWVNTKLPQTAYKASIKTRYQQCLLSLMKITELSLAQYKALLLILHKRIIPYMGVPASIMDFLTDAYDQEEDEAVPILALNSLWELMKNYNLEYPDFYTKLYSLLTPNLLYTRYRSRFFRLCDLFLSSTHLLANLVASFIKRLARLALTASAPGVVIVVPFIYNLLKKHPTCMILLQNTDTEFTDQFDNKEVDPMKTGAMSSSLWEMETLMTHYHPNVATLAKIFGEPFRKPNYNMEDFLDWSYITLLDSEKTRRYKGMAALEYEEWDSLFDNGKEKVYVEGWVL